MFFTLRCKPKTHFGGYDKTPETIVCTVYKSKPKIGLVPLVADNLHLI